MSKKKWCLANWEQSNAIAHYLTAQEDKGLFKAAYCLSAGATNQWMFEVHKVPRKIWNRVILPELLRLCPGSRWVRKQRSKKYYGLVVCHFFQTIERLE